jgi:hypothetical protein
MKLQHFSTEHGTVYINAETGESYWTASSFESFSGIHHTTVKRAIQSGHILASEMAEVLTTQGLRNGHIFKSDDEGALELLSKKFPKKLTLLAKAGANEYVHKLAGFSVTSSAAPSVELNPGLLEAWRVAAAAHQPMFQLTMEKLGYSLARVHDYLTNRLYGLTAEQSRLLPQATSVGKANVGLNHISEPDRLELVAKVKVKFVNLRHRKWTSYKHHVDTAIDAVLDARG